MNCTSAHSMMKPKHLRTKRKDASPTNHGFASPKIAVKRKDSNHIQNLQRYL